MTSRKTARNITFNKSEQSRKVLNTRIFIQNICSKLYKKIIHNNIKIFHQIYDICVYIYLYYDRKQYYEWLLIKFKAKHYIYITLFYKNNASL